MHTLPDDINKVVAFALEEDIKTGDVTANLIPENSLSTAKVICREQAVLSGKAWFDEVFHQLDNAISIDWKFNDGDVISTDDEICRLHGNTRTILTGERTALNFLQTLSGTATIVHEYSQLVKDYSTKILDTRKTIPGLRNAQKYAVLCGGGMNHRMGLYDAILIKENHIIAAGSIEKAVEQAKKQNVPIEVEVESIDELEQAIAAGTDRVLLDNFSLEMLEQAVDLNNMITAGKVELEASGGVDESTLEHIAATGVNYVSIGGLTKHLKATDFSMRFVE